MLVPYINIIENQLLIDYHKTHYERLICIKKLPGSLHLPWDNWIRCIAILQSWSPPRRIMSLYVPAGMSTSPLTCKSLSDWLKLKDGQASVSVTIGNLPIDLNGPCSSSSKNKKKSKDTFSPAFAEYVISRQCGFSKFTAGDRRTAVMYSSGCTTNASETDNWR